jgi:hypothetical protein
MKLLKAVNDFWGVAPCIFNSFDDAVSNSDYTASSDLALVNDELLRIWKEAVVS